MASWSPGFSEFNVKIPYEKSQQRHLKKTLYGHQLFLVHLGQAEFGGRNGSNYRENLFMPLLILNFNPIVFEAMYL